MRRYLTAYALWLLGVLSAAALALYYYKRIIAMGDDALDRELRIAHPPPRPPASPQDDAQREAEPTFEDTVPIEDARPPSFETLRGRTRGGSAR